MIDTVRKTIERHCMLSQGTHVLIGLSGGADSVSLLCALLELKNDLGITVSAMHINHGIRGEEADADQYFCEELCRQLKVELECIKLDIPSIASRRGIGLEQCGRDCRYEMLSSAALRRQAVIATAHTLSDSTETVLFNLARGSGISGVCGIPPMRKIPCRDGQQITLIRPLIDVTREQVEAYCREKKLTFVTDSTNSDCTYRRNLIRNKVIPVLREVNPSLHSAVERFTECAAEDCRFLDEMASNALSGCIAANESFTSAYSASSLAALPEPILRRCIMNIALNAGHNPDYNQIMLCRECILNGSGAVMLTQSTRFCVKNGLVYTDSGCDDAVTQQWQTPLCIPHTILPDGRSLIFTQIDRTDAALTQKHQKTLFKNMISCDIINGNACVRNRRDGDRFAPAGRGITKQLKKLLCEEHIPVHQRSSLVIIADKSDVLWIEGFGVSESAHPREDQDAFLVEIKNQT